MKKTIKKAICVLSATMCVMGSAVVASADTVTFNVTIPDDPYSYAVRKADTEQRFYVTGTSFSKNAILNCRSGKAGQGMSSNIASISPSSKASSASYTKYAAPNYTYEMRASSSVNGLNVRGRYTP